jgi:hypothetical protein
MITSLLTPETVLNYLYEIPVIKKLGLQADAHLYSIEKFYKIIDWVAKVSWVACDYVHLRRPAGTKLDFRKLELK